MMLLSVWTSGTFQQFKIRGRVFVNLPVASLLSSEDVIDGGRFFRLHEVMERFGGEVFGLLELHRLKG